MDAILKKLGYTKITNENLLDYYVDNLPDINDDITPEFEEDLMKQLNNVDGFREWIEAVIKRDLKNYFVSQSDSQRSLVRGGYQRMMDIKKRLNSFDKPKEKITRITGVRYGQYLSL